MSKRTKTSLAEIMGSAGANAVAGGSSLTLEHLPALLGDSLPELPRNAVGRHRLVRALQQRFGDGFRSLPGVTGLLTQFDKEIQFENRITQMKQIRYRRTED